MKRASFVVALLALVATGIGVAATVKPPAGETDWTESLRALCTGAGGSVGVAVIHIETGQSVAVEGAKRMPLFSVFKLPLAIAVLDEVAEGKLSLDKKVRITPEEAAGETKVNSEIWRQPVEKTVQELLELSLILSDNTSSDALMTLIGGPEVVTRRMRARGLSIEVQSGVRGFKDFPAHPNTGSAEELARLLSGLLKGEILKGSERQLLLDMMARTKTGQNRLRGDLPAGTPVGDKTGTGENATNDVGIITLPGEGGHLAIAVLVDGSTLSRKSQEKLIARVARAAYDHYAR